MDRATDLAGGGAVTAQALAALLLAAAIIIAPGRAVVAARLTALLAPGVINTAPRNSGPPGTASRNAALLRIAPSGVRSPIAAIRSVVNRRDQLPPLIAAAGFALAPMAVGWPRGAVGLVLSVPAFFGCRWFLRRTRGRHKPDPLLLASTWDLLAACLRGGLPVSVAVQAIAGHLSGPPAEALRRTAELAALGADPATAWEPALAEPVVAELARAARRSARSGTALATVAEGMAANARSGAADWAEAKAQRAAVAVAGPLGLCFLPAFLCLGVAPVVIGLASRLTTGMDPAI
jgi:hypothetical protein